MTKLKEPLSRFELLDILRGHIKRHGSQSAWAKHAGVSPAYVSDVLRGRRDPGPAILDVLGYVQQERHYCTYVKGPKDGA